MTALRVTTKTLKQTRRDNDVSMNYYAASFGKGPVFDLAPTPAAKPASERKPSTAPEADILKAILKLLSLHPSVAWARRMNSGAFQIGPGPSARWFRAGFVGCSDILGQMRDGRLLAIEVKAARGKVSDEQQRFIDVVRQHGGVAGVARSVGEADLIIKYGLMRAAPTAAPSTP